MKAIIYKITCLTNLHVGNGESNFDIVDNAVEKDPVTGLPTINSSGVKGAFRQYFKDSGVDARVIANIFGSEQKNSQTSSSFPGKVKFYQADLLARPVRASKGNATNYMVTSREAVKTYNRKAEVFGGAKIPLNDISGTDITNAGSIGIEGVPALGHTKFPNELTNLIASEVVLVKDSELKNCPLPVLARNQLENGISNNLWYEEVVPHKSIFTFAVSSDSEDVLRAFSDNIRPAAYVQFGGNASIGYGLCKVEPLTGGNNDDNG